MEILPSKLIKFLGIEEHRGAKELFEFNLHKLRILGVWKWDVPQWRLHRAFAFLTIISLIIFVISLGCDAYIHFNNLDRCTKVLIPALFSCLLAFKNSYLLIINDEAFELICQLQNNIFTKERPPTPQQSIILNRYAARAKFYTVVRSNIALVIIMFWLLYPIKDTLEEYAEDTSEYVALNRSKTTIPQLPFIGYYPYDVENNAVFYILTYLYQAFCGLSVFVGMPAWDMLFVSVFIHISGHFKALQHVLIHLSDEARESLLMDNTELQLHEDIRLSKWTDSDKKLLWQTDDAEGYGAECNRSVIQAAMTKQKLEEMAQYILNKCIQHHQAILRFVKKLEAFLKPVMLMQLLVSMIAFCVIGFQMSMIQIHTDATKFVKFLVSLLSAFIEQGMFYWFGGEMLVESLKIVNAAYFCEWYTASNTFRKSLNILMERAKIPVRVTAGSFSTLNLENFTKVVQSSYHYFTMLKAVHDENAYNPGWW